MISEIKKTPSSQTVEQLKVKQCEDSIRFLIQNGFTEIGAADLVKNKQVLVVPNKALFAKEVKIVDPATYKIDYWLKEPKQHGRLFKSVIFRIGDTPTAPPTSVFTDDESKILEKEYTDSDTK